MLNYMQYLNLPIKIVAVVVGILLLINLIGELLEFKGKVVPEIMKIRKFFKRKKKEREALAKMTGLLDYFQKVPETLKNVENLLNNVDKHYNKDNITQRDEWINNVNCHLKDSGELFKNLEKKLDKNSEDILSLLIDNKRDTIINFASRVINENNLVTREEFNRIFKLYAEYEKLIEDNKLINGEVNISINIIKKSYEEHMRNNTFLENIHNM